MDYTFRDLHMTGVPVERISIVADHWNSLFFEILSRHAPNVLHVEYSNVGYELPYMEDEDEGVGENTEEDANLILASPFFFFLCLEYAAHGLFKEVSHPFYADSIILDFWTWDVISVTIMGLFVVLLKFPAIMRCCNVGAKSARL